MSQTVTFTVPIPQGVTVQNVLVALCAIGVGYVLFHAFSELAVPKIKISLEPNEVNDVIEGPACPEMLLRDPSRPGKIQCYDPSTAQRIGEITAMTKEEVEAIAHKAAVAQKAWCKTTYAQRRQVLMTMMNYITNNQRDICRVSSRDSGKPRVDALLGEVLTTCEKIRCVCEHGEQWLKPEVRANGPLMVHKKSFVEYHPLGVIGVIAPWNYPFHNVYNHIASGIFAGNGVVIKVSEFTSWSSGYYQKIVKEALRVNGHSPDLVSIVTGFAEVGQAMVSCPDVDKIVFTGSPQVGRMVMQGCAPHLKPCVLELGGKDAMVICDDYPLDEVIPIAMRGTYQNAGQNCCGVERIFCYEKQYEEFITKVTKQVKGLRQGNPLGTAPVDVGAMIMPGQIAIIQRLVDDAVAKGARLLSGGRRNPSLPSGLFYEPTILADVTDDMLIAQEEVFGPVMCIAKVKNNDDEVCIRMVNDCKYGLGSSVFSLDQARAIRLGARIRAGMTTINDFAVNYLVQTLPFGGVKDSGFDRFAGPEGLRALCLQKSVVIDLIPFYRTALPKCLQYPLPPSGFTFAQSMVNVIYADSLWKKVKAVVAMMGC